MKLRILTLMLMAYALTLRAAPIKWSLQSTPEFEIETLVESLEISKLKLIKITEAPSAKNISKFYVEAKLISFESGQTISGNFNAKIKSTSPTEKKVQVIIFSRNLVGPCDYNGFQKISLNFKIDEFNEILPNSTEAKVNIYQRDLNCADKFQAFVGTYL